MPAPVIPVAAIADTFSAAMIPASSPPRPAPEQPQDAVGAKAFAVLNSYCAGCHQQPSAAGGIGKILDLTNLARDRSLVRPGVPDASRLYQTMLMRHAPMEQAKPNETGPSPLEIEALRDWIESLPASERQCPERQPVDSAELANTMQRWLEQSKPEVAKATRFISLAHLYNACANDAELAAYRQAVQKLLNGLSWARAPVRIETVGDFLRCSGASVERHRVGACPLGSAGGARAFRRRGSCFRCVEADDRQSSTGAAGRLAGLGGKPRTALLRASRTAGPRPRADAPAWAGHRRQRATAQVHPRRFEEWRRATRTHARRTARRKGRAGTLARLRMGGCGPANRCVRQSSGAARGTRCQVPAETGCDAHHPRAPQRHACLGRFRCRGSAARRHASGRPTPCGSAQQAGGSERRVERLHWMSRHRPAAVRG